MKVMKRWGFLTQNSRAVKLIVSEKAVAEEEEI